MTHFSLSHSTKRSILIAAAGLVALATGWLAPMTWQKQEHPPPVPPMDLSRGAVRG